MSGSAWSQGLQCCVMFSCVGFAFPLQVASLQVREVWMSAQRAETGWPGADMGEPQSVPTCSSAGTQLQALDGTWASATTVTVPTASERLPARRGLKCRQGWFLTPGNLRIQTSGSSIRIPGTRRLQSWCALEFND